jgi:hypothetical protein
VRDRAHVPGRRHTADELVNIDVDQVTSSRVEALLQHLLPA